VEPHVRRFLESVPVGVLGTVRPNGRARPTTVCFVLDGSTVWVSTEAPVAPLTARIVGRITGGEPPDRADAAESG
jgi:hypothetical protein